ncbi:MAG: RrF2 family transcriptional regulator [Terriglobales bacterium]
MKFSSQEEYGLRCLLRLGMRHPTDGAAPGSLTIAEVSRQEGLSAAYVAKLMRVLRTGGLVTSARGAAGGYVLARAPERISVGEALAVLGGRLYEPQFCKEHSGDERVCTHSVDCSLRSLWRSLQLVLDQVLDKTTLRDLLCNETEMTSWIGHLVSVSGLASNASRN